MSQLVRPPPTPARADRTGAEFRLVRTPIEHRPAPDLDAGQRAVVEHPAGPLLVLAGPGTGKTTALVEAVVDRVERRGARPDSLLVLTFSRRAAADLRARILARLGRTAVAPLAMTFHAFCYALVRRFGDPEVYGDTVRLLTAPEQEFRVRETLAGTLVGGRDSWPDSVRSAYSTRGFAAEIRAVLARTRQLGLDPEDLTALGHVAGRPEWVRVGEFFEEYLDVLDAEQVLDYAELVHRSRILLADPQVLATVHAEIGAVFVDEYQDTDPAQVSVLRALGGGGRDVIVVGDPDQSIYSFRGADPRGLLDFPDQFRTADLGRAPIVALGTARRSARTVLVATRTLAGRLGMPRALPADVFERFRHPVPADGLPRGRPEVLTFPGPSAEAEHIADLLRSAHLRDGLAWADMAVLVRSGRRTLPVLSRALVAAGVPVEVAGDEIPLAAELSVRPLLLALRVALHGRQLTGEEAAALLRSPLAGLDTMAVRRLSRALRRAERDELAGAGLPRRSPDLLVAALRDPDLLDDLPAVPEATAAAGMARLLQRVEREIRGGATSAEALWTLWTATAWPDRLRAEAARGGDSGRRADRDLDAVCALFDAASRSEEVAGLRGVNGFLAQVEAQQIPADTAREADLRGSGVLLATAHRAKGLEWELVVVASVQEGVWPDLRRPGSLLDADRLSRAGLAPLPPASTRIAEERRLFYVACTRARSRLVVTAVAGTDGEGNAPSRFLTELGVPLRAVPGRPARPLNLAALTGELRRVATDAGAPAALRDAAAVRLARLAEARDASGRPVAPAADPARWWGMRALSDNPVPVTAPDQPVALSGSQLAGLLTCPRQWFLSRRARADSSRSAAASFGSVVHVLVEEAQRGRIERAAVPGHLGSVWDSLNFDAKWLSEVEKVEAEACLERFFSWQEGRREHTLLGVEAPFSLRVDVGGDVVQLTGTADRVERDRFGRLRVIDFKTGRAAPTAAQVLSHDQLGVYQLAAQLGAFDDLAPYAGADQKAGDHDAGGHLGVGGAELVYLRLEENGTSLPRTFAQPSLDVPRLAGGPSAGEPTSDEPTLNDPTRNDTEPKSGRPTWVHDRLAEAVEIIRSEHFDARPGPACRYCTFASSCPTQPGGSWVVS